MGRTIKNALRSDDPRVALEALRDLLADALQDARKADEDKQGQIASLARQYRDVTAQLAALQTEKERSTVDDLARRRAARRSGTDAPVGPAGEDLGGSGSGGARGERRAAAGPVAGARPRGGARGA